MRAMDRSEIDQLWTLPLEDFTRVRDDLAKRAKEEGDADGAKEIKALRKPSVAAWAVNQLARRRSDDIRRLLGLGEVMRKAQREAFEGGGRDALRTATTERRRLVDQLVDDAEALLAQAEHGSSRAVLDKVSQTLIAAASDEDTGALVAAGILQREAVPPSGLDDMSAWLPSGTPKPRSTKRATKSKAAGGRSNRADELSKRLEANAIEAEAKAAETRSEADRLAREAEKAARAAEREEKLAAQARERADRARAEADELEDAE
jgi:hypothetical protein